MFRTQDFFYGILMCGLSFSLVMFYNLCGPFIIEHKLGFSAVTIGYVLLFMGVGWMGGGFFGKSFNQQIFLPKLRNANFFQLAFIVVMFASSFYVSNLFTLAIFAFLLHFTARFIFNNYFTYCIGRFPNSAGIAGGLTGGVAYVLTSAISYGVVALLRSTSQIYLAIGYFINSFLGFIILSVTKIKKAHI